MSGERRTLRGNPVVAAPGKLFVIGEYAVLAGAPAVVAAVNRYAVGQFVIGIEPESDFTRQAVAAGLRGLGDRAEAMPPGSVLIDSTSFRVGGKKLGLGSSAAVTVVGVAAVMEMAGMSVAEHRALCFELADGAHRSAQGGVGSGADVAAAVHGGLIRYRRARPGEAEGARPGPRVAALTKPAELRLVVFSEGSPASTPDLIRTVEAYAARRPAAYERLMLQLEDRSETFIEAIAGSNLEAAISVAIDYGAGLAELGAQAGAPIITPRFEMAADLATNLGGMAKPSGAGGGDLGIGMFGEPEAAQRFAARLEELGLRVLDVDLDLNGVHRRLPASNL
jgi:phosphomevalonate kinase